jgi:hypothetical protein
MNQHYMHRYKVWLLAKDEELRNREAAAQNAAAPTKQAVSKLTDLETLLLLYNYGRPMDLAVGSKLTLPDGQSTTCQTSKLSSESINFIYNSPPPGDSPAAPRPAMRLGSSVSLNVDQVGALKGVLTSQNKDGFQVAVDKGNRSMVSTKLAHIAVKRGIGVDSISAVKTGVKRIEPTNKNCSFTDHTAALRKGMIVNLSQFDALIRVSPAIMPPMGSRIVLRGPAWHGADVISTFEIGFMVKFCLPIPDDQFSPALKFTDD